MKRYLSFLLKIILIVFFLLITPSIKTAKAKFNNITCELLLDKNSQSVAFDSTDYSYEPKVAIPITNNSLIWFNPNYKPWPDINDSIYGYIYVIDKWYSLGLLSPDAFPAFLSYNFSEVGNFRVAFYAKDVNNNEEYYCPGQVLVYFEEYYNADWINKEQVVAYPTNFKDIDISSNNYPLIGGVKFLINFTRESVYSCLNYDPLCGYYQFLPDEIKRTTSQINYIKTGFVLSYGNQSKIVFHLQPDNRVGCSSEYCYITASIGKDNLILYTQPNNLPPAGPTPPPPGTKIFGYVKDEISQKGVPGASIRVDKKLTADSPYQFGAGTAVTDNQGYWNIVFPSDFNIYEARIIETANNDTYCEADGLTDPSFPSGAEAWVVNSNRVDWRHLPENAGPVTFFDRCSNLPTPTPTNPPPCPLAQSQENGVAETGLTNQWNYYVPFVAPFDGLVNKISVKAGNYGGAWRSITCKVTNNNGSQDISTIVSSPEFRSDSGADWRDLNYLNNPFSIKNGTTYRLYCKGPDNWTSLYWIWGPPDQINGKTYRLYICALPTAAPTPTQAPWIKLKNSSFQSNNNLQNLIPLELKSFDQIDDRPPLLPYFIRDESGVVTVKSLILSNGTFVSEKKWLAANYPNIKLEFNKAGFLNYIKSRKDYTSLDKKLRRMSLLSSFIKADGIYYLPANDDNSQFYIDNDSDLPNYNFVLIVDGTVNINSPVFNEGPDNKARKSLAILVDYINFNNDINRAFGIFVADQKFNTGINLDLGLKITGNLATLTLINNRSQLTSNNQKPSFFVVVDPKQYLDLLPYLSIAKYNIKQLK
ncbi:MAG: hypothetical protein QHH09_04310 [Microgenomates group bacterium]|nr:hypothetical protein [Microgenomates group bacterium]